MMEYRLYFFGSLRTKVRVKYFNKVYHHHPADGSPGLIWDWRPRRQGPAAEGVSLGSHRSGRVSGRQHGPPALGNGKQSSC